MRSDLEAIELGEGPETVREFINFTLNPPSGSIGSIDLSSFNIQPVSGVDLGPGNISGTPVNPGVVSSQQNLGQRFNLTTQLNAKEKEEFLFR